MKLKEALIIKYLVINPYSSEWEVALGTKTSSVLTRMYLNDLISQELVVEQTKDRERIYDINYTKIGYINNIMQSLNHLDKQLKDFDLSVAMLQ